MGIGDWGLGIGDLGIGDADVLISNNPLLTDVYFHDDTFSITNIDSQSSIFSGNNANFKIHGIADGNVQAFCTANSIPFEVIVDE